MKLISGVDIKGSLKKWIRQTIHGGRRTQIRFVMVIVLMIALCCGTVLFSQASYAVSLEGKVVGSAKNVNQINAVIARVEKRASELLGYEYHYETGFELEATLDTIPIAELEDALLGSIPEIGKNYILKIDGINVLTCDYIINVYNAKNAILERYEKEYDDVRFDNKMEFFCEFTANTQIKSAEEIQNIFDPESKDFYPGLSLRYSKTETKTTQIPFDTTFIKDNTLYEGTVENTARGVMGSKDTTVTTEYLNGKNIGTTVLDTNITKEPESAVITIGTLEKPFYLPTGEFIRPCEGILTSYFGGRNVAVGSSNHTGIDIAGDYNSEIVAADGGQVVLAEYYYGYGNCVIIDHFDGTQTLYGHCSSLCVSKDEYVGQGQVIGYMGESGVADGTHLHFEVIINGEYNDPLDYLPGLDVYID